MNAHRDALAHRFVAATLGETKAWSNDLQVAFHQLAFATLPLAILELDERSARRFARRWRTEVEAEPVPVPPTDDAWIVELASGWDAARDAGASGDQIAKLAELIRRFGPLALTMPWRAGPPAKA